MTGLLPDGYVERVQAMTDHELLDEAFDVIDRANHLPLYGTYDARAGECCEEAERRGKPDVYKAAFDAAYRTALGERQLTQAHDAYERGRSASS